MRSKVYAFKNRIAKAYVFVGLIILDLKSITILLGFPTEKSVIISSLVLSFILFL